MTSEHDIARAANLISRLERMPLNKSLYAAIATLAWCYILEAFDLGLIGQAVAVLKQLWNLDSSAVGILGSCSTAGVIIGTAFAGKLADKYGRKRILICGTFIFTFFTLIGAFYENYHWIVFTRFIAGLGAGAVFPQPYLMISELSPAKYRGRLVGACNAILGVAYILPAGCGAYALQNLSLEAAWRVPFIVGGLPVLTLILIHKYLPESPRWLMLHGRFDEVRDMVMRFEKSCGIAHDDNYVDPDILASLRHSSERRSTRKISWTTIFRPPYLSRSLMCYGLYSVTLITWYVVMVYLPTIISNHGIALSSAVALVAVFNIASATGSFAIGPVADKFGRRPATTLFIGIAIVSFLLLPSTESRIGLLVLGWLSVCFGVGTNAIFKVYIAEQYPTELRGMGVGIGEAVCRFIGGVLATYYLAYIVDAGGINSVFYFLAAAYVLSIVGMWIWGRETAGRNVEEASE